VGKGFGSVNIVQTVCTRVCEWENDVLKLFQEKREQEIKENDGLDQLNYDIF
jgi:flagellar basal body-associated protein FliL